MSDEAQTRPTLDAILERISEVASSLQDVSTAFEKRFDSLTSETREGLAAIHYQLARLDIRLDRIEGELNKTRSQMFEFRADFKEFRSHFKEPA